MVARILRCLFLLCVVNFFFSCEAEREKPSFAFDLDSNFRPQDDFYHFVNMKYIKEYRLKDKKGFKKEDYDVVVAYFKKVKQMYSDLLDTPSEGLSRQALAAKLLYESALDSSLIEEDGDAAIRFLVDAIPSCKNLPALADYYYLCLKYTCYLPVYVQVDNVYEEGKRYPALYNDYNSLFDWETYNEKSIQYEYYKEYIAEILLALGYSEEEVSLKRENIIQIDFFLDSISSLKESDKVFDKMQIADLQSKAPGFDWIRYFSNLGLSKKDSILVNDFNKIKQFALKIHQFSDQKWFDYYEFNIYDSYAFVLNKKFREPSYKYNYKLGKTNLKIDDSWNNFYDLILNYFITDATNQIYYEKFYNDDVRNDLKGVTDRIMAVFKQKLSASKWIDSETKRIGLGKLNNTYVQLFYSDSEAKYQDLKLKKQSLVRNFLLVSENGLKYNTLSYLYDDINPANFYYRLDHCYPFSFAERSFIFVPVSMLQYPFYSFDSPLYIKYAGIGTLIGHELSHMLDPIPGYYTNTNKNTNITTQIWWKDSTIQKVEEIKCKVKKHHQYFYFIPGIREPNDYETHERMCDISGFLLSYYAYSEVVNNINNKPEGSLFTNKQLFFLHYALVNRILFDTDRLNSNQDMFYFYMTNIQVNSILANFGEFKEAFNVQEGDDMFLPDSLRYQIW